MIETQQLGQPAGVDLVVLVAFPHGFVFSRIAHRQFRDVRFQLVVQPGGRRSFFKRDLQISAQPRRKTAESCSLCFDEAFHATCVIPLNPPIDRVAVEGQNGTILRMFLTAGGRRSL